MEKDPDFWEDLGNPYCHECGSCGEMGCCTYACPECIGVYMDQILSGDIKILRYRFVYESDNEDEAGEIGT